MALTNFRQENIQQSVQFFPRAYDQNGVIRKDFLEFGKQNESTHRGPSVEQFFQDYETLFFDIPSLGATGSHEYLVSRSSEFARPEKDLEDIQPLLDEITTLRAQAVADQQTIVELRTQLAEKSDSATNI